MLEIRLLLEPAAARRAAQNASKEQVDAACDGCSRRWPQMEEATGHLAYGAFGLRDAAFHDLVRPSAGNELIREMLARLHTHVHLFRLHYDTQVTFLAMGEHEAVIAGHRQPRPRGGLLRHAAPHTCCPASGSGRSSTRAGGASPQGPGGA